MYVSARDQSRQSAGKTEEQRDEEAMMHWIWNKVNPTYGTFVLKQDLLRYLLKDGDVREVFDLKDNQLAHAIESMVTYQVGCLTFDEF